ncbi:MAG: S4 domain-containing protein, partial [Nitrospirota bacterium]|nr:S4 domain-containing protein [Nitrospirota bacterium]
MKGTDSIAKVPKERLDRLVFLRGLAESRERARALILGGLVIVDGNKVDKAGTFFKSDVAIHLCGQTHPFVSRGGLKLEAALEAFDVDV